MQPDSAPKPVMDVRPPRPAAPGTTVASAPAPAVSAPALAAAPAPAPAAAASQPAAPQPLAVHEPPKDPAEEVAANAPQGKVKPADPMPDLMPKPAKSNGPKPGPRKDGPPLPAGAITMAVLIMFLLSALTVIAYISSK